MIMSLDQCYDFGMVDFDTVLIGAGPASLSTALALAADGRSVLAVDPAGSWMAEWRRRFAAHRIDHLRSSIYHHPHPDPDRFVDTVGDDSYAACDGYRLPRSTCFDRFIDVVVEEAGLSGCVIAGRAADIVDHRSFVSVELAGGRVLRAHRVVVGVDARRFPESCIEGTKAADEVVLGEAPLDGRRILVLGGGLTAARLAVGAFDAGAVVTLAARRRLAVRPFDILPGWMGPKFLAGFDAEASWVERRRMVSEGRTATIPAWARRAIADRRGLDLRNGVDWRLDRIGDVIEARFSDGSVECFEEVWEAFGGQPDVAASPLLARLVARHDNLVLDGLPVLDEALRWPGTSIHLTGALAALQLGPGAGNLHGHRRAARRIVGCASSGISKGDAA